MVRSVGSRSEDLENWVTSEFNPVPIQYKIKPMTEIFKPIFESWMPDGNLGTISAIAGDENSAKLNSTKINNFFLSKLEQYCDLILGNKDCPDFENKGCGINDICPIGEKCVDVNPFVDLNFELGFQCVKGCGFTDNCPIGEKCVDVNPLDDDNFELGFQCGGR